MVIGNLVSVSCGIILAVRAFLPFAYLSLAIESEANDSKAESKQNVSGQQSEPSMTESADPNLSKTDGGGPLEIDIEGAIILAMENNKELIVERMNPDISRTFEKDELAAFDPLFRGEVAPRRTVSDRLSRAGSSTESQTVDAVSGSFSLSKLFPTGTTVELEGSSSYTDHSLYSDTFTSNRLGVSVTQALLQGMDIRANMARVNQARIDTLISEYELRGFAEILLEQVEQKFWDYALAQKQIEIYTDSLSLAQQQLNEARERIKLGDLAEIELAAAQAEVALRRENLINARSDLAKEHLNLLRLLNPSKEIDWNRDVVLRYNTSLPSIELDDVEQHVQVALKMRPDLNQARLQVKQGDLEVVRTKNGLLPKLDAFISFGKTGYADTFNRSFSNIDGDSYDVTFGLTLEFPPVNRGARAGYSRAILSRHQLKRALENLTQLVQVDVRSAYIEVTRAREQIAATAATRNFQEGKLRSETEKFRVGKSTSLLVAQAQRDLVASQIAEIEAFANYLKALVSLYRLEGSLLQRRGISSPGGEPVSVDVESRD